MQNEEIYVDANARTIYSTTSTLNSGNLKYYTNYPPETTRFDYVFSETSNIKSSSTHFTDLAYGFEVGRFSWVWIQMLMSIVAISTAYTAYKTFGRSLLLKIMIFMLFCLIITNLAILSYTTSEMFVILDICEQVYTIVHLNQIPNSILGLAYYARPFSDVMIPSVYINVRKQ